MSMMGICPICIYSPCICMVGSGNQDSSAERAPATPQERSEKITLSNLSPPSPVDQAREIDIDKWYLDLTERLDAADPPGGAHVDSRVGEAITRQWMSDLISAVLQSSEQEIPRWQPIESAPKDGWELHQRNAIGCWWHKSYGWLWGKLDYHPDKHHANGGYFIANGGEPTHWAELPLPDPPSDASQQERAKT